jgi:uncharacterized protein
MSIAIDSDAHVVESEHTWDFLAPEDEKHRPRIVTPRGDDSRQYWLIDGKIQGFRFPSFTEDELEKLSATAGRRMTTALDAREMGNVDLRLQHMDQVGIDVQVLHNTIFIKQLTDRPDVEIALCKSWNRWLADIWKQGGDRLRWSCVLPLMSMSAALEEMEFCKENGACAVLMRPIEGDHLLHDPYHFPVFEHASRLNMGIAVHIANGNEAMCDVLMKPADRGVGFWTFRLQTAGAVHSLIVSALPERFPELRFGFIECSAAWIPWILAEAENRLKAMGKNMPKDIMSQYRIYVTCQNNDDIPYLLNWAGEDTLVIGTDYGHTDPSSDVDAIMTFKARTDLSDAVKEKILCDNARALYGI